MGNHLYRPHLSKLATAVKYAKANKKSQQGKNKNNQTTCRNALYSLNNKKFLLSFSNYRTSGKPRVIKCSFIVYHDSCKLIKSHDSDLYGLSFTCNSKKNFQVTVFYYAKELENKKSKGQNLFLDKEKSPDPVIKNVEAGTGQKIFTNPVLDIGKFVNNELSFTDFTTFLIVLQLKDEENSLFLYYKIEGKLLVKVREKYFIGKKSFDVLELYGNCIGECTVCFVSKERRVLFPCRHVCICRECLVDVIKADNKCPICRAFIYRGYKCVVDKKDLSLRLK